MLDTNIISALMREKPDENIERAFRDKGASCVIAAPVLYELAYGLTILPDGTRKRKLSEGLDIITKGMTILPFDRPAAQWLAIENARLRSRGLITGILDGQIAAVTATRGCVLVTRNVRDFEHYTALHIESWTD
ncbi:MAG TPA: PIN domain-containing protein [Polyangiaceae bacterium]|nr:PIN domain-containing protein [Polyangiaceae bacterium]